MTQVPQGIQLHQPRPDLEKVPVSSMSNGKFPTDSQQPIESANSRLNLTGAAIRSGKDRSRNGLTGDIAEPGGAPDIVLPHQDAQFVQHIAMDIGGSLIKLVYFSSGDDDDGMSSEALGSDEHDVSPPRSADNSSSSSPQRPDSPPAQAPRSGSSTQKKYPEAYSALTGADAVSRARGEPHPSKPRAQPNSTSHTTTSSPSVSPSRIGLHSHPIPALNTASHDALPQCVHSHTRARSYDAARPGSPADLDGGDPPQRDSISTPSEKGRQGGRLHFVKFESTRVHDAINFIEQKRLHCRRSGRSSTDGPLFQVRATGGGAFKFADLFRERLGVVLKKEDEIACLVQGTNFLLRAIRNEAFEFNGGEYAFKQSPDLRPLFPYLLVNIGSGVSFVKVDGEGSFERVSGTNLGGGTFWGLCRLLTRVRSFDEMLELSSQGDSSKVDMLVGDIYGGKDYESIGLTADTIASSFGKVVSQEKELEDYNPADIALALCRMVSYNIGHLAFLNAKRYGISRLFFGGFFIRGHPYTMDVISYAIRFWSKGEMHACFLRHEGFLGAMGAFLEGHPQLATGVATGADNAALYSGGEAAQGSGSNGAPEGLQARFVERFAMGSPFSGGTINGPPFTSLSEKVSWVEKFVQVGAAATEAAREEHAKACVSMLNEKSMELSGHGSPRASFDIGLATLGGCDGADSGAPFAGSAAGGGSGVSLGGGSCSSNAGASTAAHVSVGGPMTVQTNTEGSLPQISCGMSTSGTGGGGGTPGAGSSPPLKIGVLHYSPSLRPFPLLADPAGYNPNTYDLGDPEEREFWLSVLAKTVPTVVHKACLASGERSSVRRRAKAMGTAMTAHFERLQQQPEAYGLMGLGEVFEMREECLREFRFYDIHANDKQRENMAALQVLGDLLSELDHMPPRARLLSLVQGVLAANIFDWGAQACVDLYHDGTILEIYQKARRDISQRPWRVDDYDAFEAACFARSPSPFRKVMLFVDNAGADAVLGMLPLARELLCMGADVVLVANSYPAINDITVSELMHVVDAFAVPACSVIAAARAAATAHARRRVSTSGSETRPPAAGEGSSQGGVSMHDEGGLGGPKLQILGSGSGGPCLDLRRISADVAAASRNVDLVIIEGMGRSVHTNLNAKLKCPTLKLAMIKTQRVAEKLFKGNLFDCMCRFDLPS